MASQELDPLMKAEMLSWLNRGKRTPAALFEVNIDMLDVAALAEASFVETNRPYVYLNKAEQPKERIDRKKRRDSAPKHSLKTIKASYGPA